MLEIVMPSECTDGDVVAAVAYVRQVAQPTDVDQHRRRRQPQLHQGQQRVTAGQQLGVLAVLPEQLHGVIGRLGPHVVEAGRDHRDFASWMSDHSRCGDAGISTSVMPKGDNASTMALITAGVAAMVPASPMPFTPRMFVGDGVTV